jgi:hypothetical protein
VPTDFADGHFLIDDDLATVLDQVLPGVSMTVFIDCCHSGTITRLAMGTPATGSGGSAKARSIPATPEMEAAHTTPVNRLAQLAAQQAEALTIARRMSFSASVGREKRRSKAPVTDTSRHEQRQFQKTLTG